MQMFRSARWLMLALLVSLVPASSRAAVSISVGFAPPLLPVYVQPVCPDPGLMWTPGYWAYGPGGYYWVPGAWVPAPYVDALWTPGYWGWSGGLYIWHGGYWGPHVGYYGGVDYGFGYGGIGFAGGAWRGGVFDYNTAVMHVGAGGGWGGRVYNDSGAVDRGFVARDSHVAFSGGPGGIHHDPTPEEKVADRDQHRGPSEVQQHHAEAARSDKASYAKNNGGNPAHGGVAKPLAGASRGMAAGHSVGESHGAAMSHAPVAGGTHSTFAGGTHTSSTATTHRAPTVHAAPAMRTAHAAPAMRTAHAMRASTMTSPHAATAARFHAPARGVSHPAPAAHAPSGRGGSHPAPEAHAPSGGGAGRHK